MMLIGALALLGGADATWATTCTDEVLDQLETQALTCPAGEGVYSSVTSTYFQEVLTLAELQAPIGDCDIHDLHAGGVNGGGACTNNFFMQGNYVRFLVGTGGDRSELRIPSTQSAPSTFPGNTETKERLRAQMRLCPLVDGDSYTFMQLHSKDSTVNPDGPLVRLYVDQVDGVDTLRSVVKNNATADDLHSVAAQEVPLPTAATAEDVWAAITLQENELKIFMGEGQWNLVRTETVSWTGENCYFKTGIYANNVALPANHVNYPVDISYLEYTTVLH